jgi:Na+-driven multidrug efflux pump
MSFPIAFQASIIAIGVLVVHLHFNNLGAVAAYTAAQKIDTIAIQPMMSPSITMAAYTAENYGAKKYRRKKKE